MTASSSVVPTLTREDEPFLLILAPSAHNHAAA